MVSRDSKHSAKFILRSCDVKFYKDGKLCSSKDFPTEMEIFIRGSKTDPGMQDLKEEAASQGLSEETVSTHGLRIGGATAMHKAGASTAVIQTLGRWASDVFKIYTRYHAQKYDGRCSS